MSDQVRPAGNDEAPFDWAAALAVALWIAMMVAAILYVANPHIL